MFERCGTLGLGALTSSSCGGGDGLETTMCSGRSYVLCNETASGAGCAHAWDDLPVVWRNSSSVVAIQTTNLAAGRAFICYGRNEHR